MGAREPRNAHERMEQAPLRLEPPRRLPRLVEVGVSGPLALSLFFDDGLRGDVDLTDWAREHDEFAPLADHDIFATARIANWGSTVTWGEVLDEEGEGPIGISAWQLWRLAGERAKQLMAPAAFRAWRKEQGLSLTAAAKLLGLSRRMISYYDSGDWPVPRLVMLVCLSVATAKAQERYALAQEPVIKAIDEFGELLGELGTVIDQIEAALKAEVPSAEHAAELRTDLESLTKRYAALQRKRINLAA